MLTEQDIIESIEEVFQLCSNLNRKAFWNAIVPTDADSGSDLSPGQKMVTYVPGFEFDETKAFITLIDNLIKDPSLPKKDKIRLMLTGYCRLMELDLSLTIIWNLLRAASGQPASWKFTKVSKKSDILTCEYPREKIEEICLLSKNLKIRIGDVLKMLWNPHLRNAVSHSQYFLTDRFIPTGGVSPISRKQGYGLRIKGHSLTFDEVQVLYELAQIFVFGVFNNWSRACRNLNRQNKKESLILNKEESQQIR